MRHDKDVLLLCFEDMKTDLPGAVRDIARFLEFEIDEALLEVVVKQASFDFMLAHKHKFDDLLMRDFMVRTDRLPPGGDSAKVRQGRVGAHRRELPAEISTEMDAVWRKEIRATLGLSSYQALRQRLLQGP